MSDSIANIVERVAIEMAHRAAHNIETLAVAIGHTPDAGDMEMMILASFRHEIDAASEKLERR